MMLIRLTYDFYTWQIVGTTTHFQKLLTSTQKRKQNLLKSRK